MLRTPDTDAASDEGPDQRDLTVGIQTRVSPRANEMIRERARQDGIKAATWVRIKIYEALGLMKRGHK